ncbi:MAG: ATP-binding protein [Kiloniellales bacterium]
MRNMKMVRPLGVPLLERYAVRVKALIAARKADVSAVSAFDALERAYRYGQSETAATVLHSVRNLLNPLMLRLGSSPDSGLQPMASQISRILSEAIEPSCDAERRAKLTQYLDLAFQQLTVRWDQEQARHGQLLQHIRQIEILLNELNEISAIDRSPELVTLQDAACDIESIGRSLQDAGVKLRLHPDLRHLPPFLARRFQLKQVLIILLANAWEAIEMLGAGEGYVELSGRLERRGRQGFVHTVVRDNGCGIAQDDLALIFQREFSMKSGPGYGMGLHWCANCVTEMGGQIFAESEGKGQGAAFHVLLPTPKGRP